MTEVNYATKTTSGSDEVVSDTTEVTVVGSVSTTGLTDSELRATPVPVSDGGSSLTVDGTVAVTGTFWQATQPVSAASLPLPTGAATETTLASVNTKTPSLGQATMANSSPVVIASNQTAVPVSGTFWQTTQPVSASSLPLPTGAATETTLASVNTKTPALGQTTMANSTPVVIASNQTAVPVSFSAAAATRYFYNIPSSVHVAVANTVFWDLWNNDPSLIVRVLGVWHIPDMVTAVATGVGFSWKLARTTAIGTGGSAQTAWVPDTTQAALDADITFRLKPTGGATESTILVNYQTHGEETNVGNNIAASQGGLNVVPSTLRSTGTGIVVRPSQGLRCVQITNSALGNSGFLIEFTVE